MIIMSILNIKKKIVVKTTISSNYVQICPKIEIEMEIEIWRFDLRMVYNNCAWPRFSTRTS